MIVISEDVVLPTEDQQAGINENNPRVGWHNIVPEASLNASTSASEFPVSNLLRPEPWLKWRATGRGECAITVTRTPAEVVNYFGVAGHNFGTAGISVKLQQSFDGGAWSDVSDDVVPPDDRVLMMEFPDTDASQHYRLFMTAGSATPELGALNIGRVLRMQRRLYVGYKPLTLNRTTEVSSGFSEDGQFLGRVKRRQMLDNDAEFRNVTPEWVRNHFDEFQEAAETLPFFFAWRPGTYPKEVGYMWFKGDPDITNQQANGMMSISMKMQGIR